MNGKVLTIVGLSWFVLSWVLSVTRRLWELPYPQTGPLSLHETVEWLLWKLQAANEYAPLLVAVGLALWISDWQKSRRLKGLLSLVDKMDEHKKDFVKR
jgi:hypothetical protein